MRATSVLATPVSSRRVIVLASDVRRPTILVGRDTRISGEMLESALVAGICSVGARAVLIEVIKGRVGVNFWTLHSFQLGATFDMLIFMRVLGLRTKALQAAAQHAKR